MKCGIIKSVYIIRILGLVEEHPVGSARLNFCRRDYLIGRGTTGSRVPGSGEVFLNPAKRLDSRRVKRVHREEVPEYGKMNVVL